MADRYAVIGNPIAQSKSPMIHTAFAQAAGQAISYVPLLAPLDGFAAEADRFREAGGRGMNVTAPFKVDAFAYADRLLDRARLAGAVNTLRFEAGEAVADNTDGIGLLTDIERNLGFSLAGRRVLLLGAGGAVRGVILPFLQAAPATLVMANREAGKAQEMAAEFHPYGMALGMGYGELADQPPFDLVVNATSASLFGELPPVPAASFAPGCLAYELAYGKGLTPFLQLARASGAGRLADGVGMLVEQAAEAFAWWRGVRPDTAPMIRHMTVPLV
jgi:shikimate dehydrogenase